MCLKRSALAHVTISFAYALCKKSRLMTINHISSRCVQWMLSMDNRSASAREHVQMHPIRSIHKCTASCAITTYQVSAQRFQPFSRYGKGVRTAARAYMGSLGWCEKSFCFYRVSTPSVRHVHTGNECTIFIYFFILTL